MTIDVLCYNMESYYHGQDFVNSLKKWAEGKPSSDQTIKTEERLADFGEVTGNTTMTWKPRCAV